MAERCRRTALLRSSLCISGLAGRSAISATCGYSNQFPALTNPGARTSVVGNPTSLQLAGIDPDGAPVTYFASGLPAGLSLMVSNGYISGVPAAVGVYSVTASVFDGVLTSAPQVFTWSVSAASTSASAPSTSDTIAPSIAINSPTTAATYRSSASSLALSGSAGDNVSVVSVSWTNDRGGSGNTTPQARRPVGAARSY